MLPRIACSTLLFLSLAAAALAATAPTTPTFILKFGNRGSAPGQVYHPRFAATDALGNVYVSEQINSRIQVFDRFGNPLRQFGTNGAGDGQFQSISGVAVDRSGNVYVADQAQNRIQKFSNDGTFLMKWGSGGSGDGQFNTPLGLTTDAADNLYVVDFSNHRIQKFSRNGAFLAQWGGFGSGNGQLWHPWDVAVDRSGFVYVTDGDNNRIVKFTNAGAYVTHWPTPTGPYGLAVDPLGNLFLTAGQSPHVFKYTNTGTLLTQWGGAGTGDGQFTGPVDVAIDAAANLYVCDLQGNRIQKFSSSGETIAERTPFYVLQWGGSGGGPGQLDFPRGITFDGTGNVYVSDALNERVQKFGRDGHYLTNWGSPGAGSGQFSSPGELSFSPYWQLLFVVDGNNNRIQYFDATGTYGGEWGSPGNGPGQFWQPYGITADDLGGLYVTDSGNDRVQKFWGASPVASWGNHGTGPGEFDNPMGIAVDGLGNVYVADNGNHRIQKFSNGGTFLTQWGALGSGNGQFVHPAGVAVDADGNVYVADTGNDRIQKFNSSGHWLSTWGGFGTGDGQFEDPWTVGIDAGGNLYVADTGWDRMQKFLTPAAIALVSDVGNDQGRQVMLRVLRSSADTPLADFNITGYEIYRRNDPLPGAWRSTGAAPSSAGDEAQLAGWTYLMTAPAHGESEYNVVVPTLADATASSLEYSAFMVRAVTPDPFTFFDSATEGGFSIDNLPPPAPAPFMATYSSGATHLHWGVSPAPDFATFRLHRGPSTDFVPGPGNLLSAQPDTGYSDPGAAGSWYKLVAVDVNGNESPVATLGPGSTTDAPQEEAAEFALRGVWPNPARGDRLTVRFSLPNSAPARLELLDVTGRRVAGHEVGPLGPGRHTLDLAQGQRLPPGIYLVRLTRGSHAAAARVAVVD